MTDNIAYIWDNLTEMGIATNEEIGLACALCGTTVDTLNRVLYIRAGYRSLEQMLEDED